MYYVLVTLCSKYTGSVLSRQRQAFSGLRQHIDWRCVCLSVCVCVCVCVYTYVEREIHMYKPKHAALAQMCRGT